ncbi:hypothetical protein E2C01_093055 [Portunus trituberculatus]|uniref:Uncharacterized protein n=1 Tax=Portunus trituberculatus TaxID=210409 RepID=A0A5B7JTV7_PORTR|nr:hypothetical protein [Portunus trituberculatus]
MLMQRHCMTDFCTPSRASS